MLRDKGKLIAPRKTHKLTYEQKEERAIERAKSELGEDEYLRLQKTYKSIKESSSSDKHLVLDGMIINMIQRNLSQIEIKTMFRCGGYRILRLQKVLANPELLKKKRRVPKHAVSDDDLEALKAHLGTFDTEDGFPCAHRRPRKFFIQQGLTWVKVWGSYEEVMKKKGRRVLSLRR